MSHSHTRRIAITVFEGVELLDVTGPAQVFSAATRLLGEAARTGAAAGGAAGAGPGADAGASVGTYGRGHARGYTVELVGPRRGEVECAGGLRLSADRAFGEIDGSGIDTLIIPGALQLGPDGFEPAVDPEVVRWVRETSPRTRRVASVCTGAHILAEAGLLAGRRATTHWATADRLAAQYPDITVDADAVYVRADPVWTGAGVSAGIDMSLALVADDHGRRLALATAQWMVMYLQRPGGQSQFSAPLERQRTARADIAELLAWIDAHLDQRLTLPVLAERAGLSDRQFIRVFTRETGSTPAAYVEAQRVEAARRLLQESDLTIAAVAGRCGFGSTETFHRTFRQHTSVTPHAYRQRFCAPDRSSRPSPAADRPTGSPRNELDTSVPEETS
ncbi:GlxA family transcriptional regulator [Kitasatospora sp. NPDC087315]|uniref:GlxA family transcriptional regulator n=1 Tax=Kitasatospora sp. NPDC087315 TaxID=3364069 RepID=UPI0038195733